jgi:hypothetical protein
MRLCLNSNIKERWNELYFDSLVEHFEELRKEAGPIATRFVRERTGACTTRDDNELAEYLAPNFSKRQCYYKYCLSRGVKVSSNNRGNILTEEIEGVPRLPIPSWGAYRTFWAKEYPNLRVSRPAEDICSYCYVFHNRFRYKQQQRNVLDEEDVDNDSAEEDEGDPNHDRSPSFCLPSSLDSDDEEDEAPGDGVVQLSGGEVAVEEEAVEEEEDVDEPTQQSEKAILDAAKHVQMARAQRQLVNEKMSKAKEDALSNTIHPERTHTLIVDYGQNMQLPWFGTSQPGDTYYFTPLNVYNLGVVDVSHPAGEHLYCHIYKEGDGRKGGNNVASLLMKSLRDTLKILQEGCTGKELNVVFDNCPGQNKNHHVLWLVPYLLEMGYFENDVVILIRGIAKVGGSNPP